MPITKEFELARSGCAFVVKIKLGKRALRLEKMHSIRC